MMNTIIREQTIPLADQYESIKKRIRNDPAFSNLSQICAFDDDQQSLTFKTEKIHPEVAGIGLCSVMLLFSNPHPLSVKTGIFLSEPRSRSFWARLFESQYMSPPDQIRNAIANWDSTTPEVLSECLMNCAYSRKVKLFFDCLEALPTNQYSHLNKLFQGERGRALRKQALRDPGFQNLVAVSKQNNISSWIVFSAEAYRRIIGERSIAKAAPTKICKAIDGYRSDHDSSRFWDSLGDMRKTINYETRPIKVYLSLIARYKYRKTENGEKYFTIMLNQILEDILGNRI